MNTNTTSAQKKKTQPASVFFMMLFFILIPAFHAGAQLIFQKIYGGSSGDNATDMHAMPGGGYVFGASTSSFLPANQGKSYVIRTDNNGDTLWTSAFGGTGGVCDGEYINEVWPVNDGGVIAAGGKVACNSSGSGHITRLDANGNIIWCKQMSPSGEDAYPVIQCADGNFVVGGGGFGVGAGGGDAIMMKLDEATGDTLWSKTYGGPNNDYFTYILQTPDNGFISAGFTYSFGAGRKDIYVVKTDANGNVIWSKAYGTSAFSEEPYGNCMQATSDGGFILTGYGDSVVQAPQGIFLLKIDATGNMQWAKYFTGQYGHGLKQTPDGGYAIAGRQYFAASNTDALLIKTDANGNEQWVKVYGGAQSDSGDMLDLANDSGFVLGGSTTSFSVSRDVYVIKTDPNGISGCNEQSVVLATSAAPFIVNNAPTQVFTGFHTTSYPYFLTHGGVIADLCTTLGENDPQKKNSLKIFPNPSVGMITIQSQNKLGAVVIYNTLGEIIFNEQTDTSEQEIDLSSQPPGIYFLLVNGGFKKIMRE